MTAVSLLPEPAPAPRAAPLMDRDSADVLSLIHI